MSGEGGGARGPGGPPVGDAERQKAVDALCEAFADDRLPVAEFERRVEVAHRAATLDELRALLSDLPSPAPVVRARDAARPEPRPSRHPTLPAGVVRDYSLIAGIFGGGTRRGSWRPARVNHVMGIFGGFEVDFREAPLPTGITEVRVFAMFGGGEIIVPPDVAVEVSAMGILGGFEERLDVPGSIDPDAPVIRITGLAVMGGAEVSVRYPGESKKDAARRRRDEKRRNRRLKRGRSDA